MAKSAIDTLCLDKLIIMPASTPPHKQGKRLSPAAARLHACALAFENEPKVEVSDYEIQQKGTSYTYLTCRHFKALYQSATLYFLVGTDMLRNFPTWKNPSDILQNATLAVCARAEKQGWAESENAKFFQQFKQNFVTIDYNGKAVSSTEIRVLAGAGMDLTPFMPQKVAEYIHKNKLYFIPNADKALALEDSKRREHSLRVAKVSAKRAVALGIDENKAIVSALFHDCAKSVPLSSPLLDGFCLPTEYGEVPKSVVHQFAGAYLAEHIFGITDSEVLNAIRYHTSGRANMTELEKLVFLADMVEENRNYDCVEILRSLFYEKKDLNECLTRALMETVLYLQKKGVSVYPLTLQAYEFYKNAEKE